MREKERKRGRGSGRRRGSGRGRVMDGEEKARGTDIESNKHKEPSNVWLARYIEDKVNNLTSFNRETEIGHEDNSDR